MSTTPLTPERLVEAFLAERRSGSRVDARAFAARHPGLGPEFLDALESLDALETVRVEGLGPLLPERLGPFRILREIGRGGMGVVVEAVEEPLGRRVALKLLPPELIVSPAARTRFQREAALAARLDHSGICTVYGAGVVEGRPWIAMRCVEGETLGKRIRVARAKGQRMLHLPRAEELDPARAIAACIARVARSLAAAHTQGVLHRDVKPSNVMVTPSGEPVLLDFGLAIEPDSDAATLTRTGELAGTPAYLAPELIAGELARSDAQCDVYALGVTLYECLALEPPFRGPTRGALYNAVLAGGAVDVRRSNPSVPRDLAVVVATALERDRASRYASAEHLALDLEAVVEHHPIAARSIGPLGRLLRWIRREPRQALLAGALVAAALVLALAAGMLIDSREKVRAGEVAQRAREVDETIFDAYIDLGAKQRDEADAKFVHVLALDPGNEEAFVGRVFAMVRSGRNDEALALLRDAPRTRAYEGLRALAANQPPPIEDPQWLASASANELFIDGERLRLEGERRPLSDQVEWMHKALERFDEAVIRAPRARALYHKLRAWTAAAAGDERAMRSSANALVSLWPTSANALYQAGSCLADFDAAAARPLLARAAELDPTRAATFQCLGDADYRLGDYDSARAAFEHALELDPRDALAYNGLACVLDLLGCHDEQRAALVQALALSPDFLQARSNLASLEWRYGSPERAVRNLEIVLELDPGLYLQRGLLAGILNQLGEANLACEQMAIALAQTAHDASQWADYARHLLGAGKLKDALEAVQIARELEPDRAELDDLEDRVRYELDDD